MEYPSMKFYENKEKTEPVAEQILEVLLRNKISYIECQEALEIAMDKLMLTCPH